MGCVKVFLIGVLGVGMLRYSDGFFMGRVNEFFSGTHMDRQ